MSSDSWQNQSTLSQETIPQDSHRLLIVIENIEMLGVTATAAQKPAAKGNGNVKSKGKSDMNQNGKGTDSSTGQSNKKKQMERHCVLCKKYSGKPATHNTGESTHLRKMA